MARSAVTKGQLGKIAVEIGIEGMDEIKKNIAERIDRAAGIKAKQVWMRAALVFVREVRDSIHSVTGKLSKGVFASYGIKTKPNVLVGVVAPHGWVVEHGHGGPHPAGPHPFFKPGVLAAKPIAGVIIAEGMRDLISK